jgi:integrase/recombinase XerD
MSGRPRHDLKNCIRMYVDTAGIAGETKDRPLFRSTLGTTNRLTDKPLTTKDVCRMVKRRLKDAGLPSRLSPHSFRVTAITSLLEQGVPMDIGQPYCLL